MDLILESLAYGYFFGIFMRSAVFNPFDYTP